MWTDEPSRYEIIDIIKSSDGFYKFFMSNNCKMTTRIALRQFFCVFVFGRRWKIAPSALKKVFPGLDQSERRCQAVSSLAFFPLVGQLGPRTVVTAKIQSLIGCRTTRCLVLIFGIIPHPGGAHRLASRKKNSCRLQGRSGMTKHIV